MAPRGRARLCDVIPMGLHMLTLRARTAARAAGLALSCALALLVMAPRVACAQGTSGAFADPLSVGELKMLLEQRMELPSGVWPQIQAAHDAYARRAEEFRNGDIEKFQKRSRSMEGGQGDPQAKVAQWQAIMREYAELSRKADSIDDELFMQVAKALESSPDAAAAVESAKLARRRQAMRMGMGRAMMSPSTMADVEQVTFDVQVPDAAREAVRQALAGYGARQSPALREHGDRLQQMYQEFMKAQMSMPQVPAGDGDAAQSGGMVLNEDGGQAVWARFGPEVTRQRKQILATNRATARAVMEALAAHPDVQQRFADRWIVESYPGIPDSESTKVPQTGRRALRLKVLDDAARASVRQAIADWRTADDAIVTEWSAATDEFESTQTPWSFDQEGYRAFNARVADLQRRRTERAALALQAIDLIVGVELSDVVRGTDSSRDDELLGPEPAEVAEARAVASLALDDKARVRDYFSRLHRVALADWSRPFGAGEMARMAAAIGGDEGQRAILESLVSDHAAGWAARVDPVFAQSLAKIEGDISVDDAGVSLLMSVVPDSIAAARVQRDALDAQFFDGLAAVTAGSGAERVAAALRQLRAADSAARDDASLRAMHGMGGQRGTHVDPLEGVWSAVAAERREELVALVESSVPAIAQAAVALSAASTSLADVMTRAQATRSGAPEAEQRAIQQQMTDAFQRREQARAALDAAEESLSARALELLAEGARARVQAKWVRARHPQYFRDDPVQRAYDRALAMEGLDEPMRTAITTALTEYLSARDASEGVLAAALRERVDYPMFDADSPEAEAKFAKQYEAWMLGNEKVERALFARRGSRERGLVTLSGILGADRSRAARVPDAAELAREEARLKDGDAGSAE